MNRPRTLPNTYDRSWNLTEARCARRPIALNKSSGEPAEFWGRGAVNRPGSLRLSAESDVLFRVGDGIS